MKYVIDVDPADLGRIAFWAIDQISTTNKKITALKDGSEAATDTVVGLTGNLDILNRIQTTLSTAKAVKEY